VKVRVTFTAKRIFISTFRFKQLERSEKQKPEPQETMMWKTWKTLAWLEHELQLQECEQARTGDYTIDELVWFADGEAFSVKNEEETAKQSLLN